MDDQARREHGMETYRRVYGSLARETPVGVSLYLDTMVNQLFAEVWSREGLAIRDRRLLVMGVLAAQGQGNMVDVQIRRAVENGELTLDEADEAVLQLTHYVGWGLATQIAMIVPRLREELAANAVTTDKADG